jgi:hypothetical protein
MILLLPVLSNRFDDYPLLTDARSQPRFSAAPADDIPIAKGAANGRYFRRIRQLAQSSASSERLRSGSRKI